MIKVEIQSTKLSLMEGLRVHLIYCKNQHHSKDIVSLRSSRFQMLEEDIQGRTEERTEQLNGSFRLNIEKLSSEDNFVENSIHESFVDRFENLLYGELLSFLAGDIEEDDVIGIILLNDPVPVHERVDAPFVLVEVGGLDLREEGPQMDRLERKQLISLHIQFNLQFIDLAQIDFIVVHVDFGHDLSIAIAELSVNLQLS